MATFGQFGDHDEGDEAGQSEEVSSPVGLDVPGGPSVPSLAGGGGWGGRVPGEPGFLRGAHELESVAMALPPRLPLPGLGGGQGTPFEELEMHPWFGSHVRALDQPVESDSGGVRELAFGGGSRGVSWRCG